MTFKKYINLKFIGVGILVWLLFHIDLGQVLGILLESDLAIVALSLGFMLVSVLFKFIRYQYILMQQGVRIPFAETARFSLAAMYLSSVTPGRIGEISKAYFIHKANSASLHKLLAGNLVDRFFDIYALLLTALIGFTFIFPSGINSVSVIVLIIIIAAIPFLFLTQIIRELLINFTQWCQGKINKSNTWSNHLRLFFSEIDFLLNRKIFWGFVASFVAYMLYYGSCYFMCISLTIHLSYYKIALFIACANLLSFFPITVAGIGTREASLVYLFSIESLSSESAIAFSTLFFSLTHILFGIIGFLSSMTLRLDRKVDINDARIKRTYFRQVNSNDRFNQDN